MLSIANSDPIAATDATNELVSIEEIILSAPANAIRPGAIAVRDKPSTNIPLASFDAELRTLETITRDNPKVIRPFAISSVFIAPNCWIGLTSIFTAIAMFINAIDAIPPSVLPFPSHFDIPARSTIIPASADPPCIS